MSRFKLIFFVIFTLKLYKINAQISDKRLCVDEECKVPISMAKTLLRYSSPDSRILSFAPNVDITIYSKSAGSREDLWGGAINGKRGYVPRHLVRETKILKKPTLLVNTEISNHTVPSTVEPDKVQEPYEVVDGTTIYLNPQEGINPTTTDSPVQATALPVESQEATPSEESGEQQAMEEEEEEEEPDIEDEDDEMDNEEGDSEDEEIEIDLVSGTGEEKTDETLDQKTEKVEAPPPGIDLLSITIQQDIENETKEGLVDANSETENTAATKESEQLPTEDQDIVTQKSEDAVVSTDAKTIENSEISPEIAEQNEQNLNELDSSNLPTTQQAETIDQNTSNLGEAFLPSDGPHQQVEIIEQNTDNLEADKDLLITEQAEIVDQNTQELEDLDSSNEQNLLSEGIDAQNETSQEDHIDHPEIPTTANEDLPAIPSVEIEVTTSAPELEVPQPLDVEEVTPNPTEIEEPAKVEEIIPTLPPLGLFNFHQQAPDNVDVSKEADVQSEIEQDQEFDYTKPIEEKQPVDEKLPEPTEHTNEEKSEGTGFLSGFLNYFNRDSEVAQAEEFKQKEVEERLTSVSTEGSLEDKFKGETISSPDNTEQCDATSCEPSQNMEKEAIDFINFNSDVFIYLVTTAISVIIFLFGYLALDKSKREGPLVAKINKLEKELLIILKENEILQEKVLPDSGYETNDKVSSEVVESLQQQLFDVVNAKNSLEEQVQSLEKELENSTEVGMELNRMLTEILSSESGSDVIKANVEHLQRQLVEQQGIINSVNETLTITNTENHELKLELELSNKKVLDLQAELDKLLLNILKIEEEKEIQQTSLESQIANYKQKYEEVTSKLRVKEDEYNFQIKQLTDRLEQTSRKLNLKIKEHVVLADTVKQLKAVKSNDGSTLKTLLEVTGIKAEIQLLQAENEKHVAKLRQEQDSRSNWEKKALRALEEVQQLKAEYDAADKSKVETETKLDVLSNYFKEREAQLQKEISKHESLWVEKQGEATSTTERIKFMQEQLQNYKAQTDSLKQEIVSQEVELKSQISVLEKKVHENWVNARQAERKVEEAKQEAAQLRHRLTLRERALQEDKTQRFQSPVEQNGDLSTSALESPASPPLLYGGRDHITKSPAIPGLPPFLPPPPGVPFMPPPLHGVPFIPPPPNMFPGDHRPPPLGRMSSPPLNSRYSPSSRGYSPYDRNSSSPSDSEYGASPPHRRGYSPFNSREDDRRDYKRAPPGRSNGRNILKGGSSGSGHSNESLEKINRQHSRV